MPSVFHGQAEARGFRRTRRPLQEEIWSLKDVPFGMRMRIKRHFFISQLFYCTGDERTAVEKFWRIFEKQLLSLPIPPLRTVSILILMLMKKSAKELFALLLYGKKRAACNSLYALAVDGNPIPQRRDYHVVTGRADTRRCIIRIKNVIYLPFRDKTFAAVNVKMRIWIPGNPILSAFFQRRNRGWNIRFRKTCL